MSHDFSRVYLLGGTFFVNIAAGIFALLGAVLTIFQGISLNDIPGFSLCSLFIMMLSGNYNPALRRLPTGIGIAIIILVVAASVAVLGAFLAFLGSKASGCFVASVLLTFGALAAVNANAMKSGGLILREAALWGTFYIIAALCSAIYKPTKEEY